VRDNDSSADDIGTQYYATQLGIYDEMYATEKRALPHWKRFMAALDTMGIDRFELRRKEAQRLLRENGVTYNVYGDSQNLTRPWQLDPIPLLISSHEWLSIEAGLKQRADLLDLILKDIYGKQNLLKKGLLPAELIFGHEGFLHPCMSALHHQKRHLTIYSANLARGPNGSMWVLDDRTQAPSGSGYALENRTVMTRVLPDIFCDTQVRRLSSFFKLLHKGLVDIAPHNKEDPRIVILTPGPLNETYFEHAYLAAYLGYSLVQGDDLTVRDGRVWLKSLTGLQAIDVILRRIDDSFCDPLEMFIGSKLGVAGLLEVVRRGNVAIANPLGSSVLENPGLLAFLPRLSRYFLDQELKLPSIATWWCGQKRERDFVLQNIDNLVIKPINRGLNNHAVFGGLLSSKEKDNLRSQIAAKPHFFIGQEHVNFSTLPAFIDQQIEPRNAILRSFVVATGDDYEVMPGGLTRIAPQKDNFTVSNQAGGISKDTWVLATEPDKKIIFWTQPPHNQRIDAVKEPLTSRAADHLFWVGRHLERAEAVTRLLRSILIKHRETLDFKDPVDGDCLTILLRTLTQVTGTYPGFIKCDALFLKSPDLELLSLVKDSHRNGSLSSNINAFFKAAFSIRDFWSQDTWRSVDTIHRRWQERVINTEVTIDHLQENLDDLMNSIVAFTGLTSESMTREAAWVMLDSGRRLERALALIALLRSTLALRHKDALQHQVLEAVLISTDSLSIYQRRYRSYIQLPLVLDLLLLDESHPRSVGYQLKQLSIHINSLSKGKSNRYLSEEERLILKIYTDIRLCNLHELTQVNEDVGVFKDFEKLLSTTSELLWRLSEVIAETYFSHSQISQLMPLNSQEDEL
jgi:uncharacterized circularly permuted ATP-grasp superfamily protein/uncharacterized alpha-E superfamily protein